MKKDLLELIIKKKKQKIEFSIITNLKNSESCIYETNKKLSKNFQKYKNEIEFYFNKKKKWSYRWD